MLVKKEYKSNEHLSKQKFNTLNNNRTIWERVAEGRFSFIKQGEGGWRNAILAPEIAI